MHDPGSRPNPVLILSTTPPFLPYFLHQWRRLPNRALSTSLSSFRVDRESRNRRKPLGINLGIGPPSITSCLSRAFDDVDESDVSFGRPLNRLHNNGKLLAIADVLLRHDLERRRRRKEGMKRRETKLVRVEMRTSSSSLSWKACGASSKTGKSRSSSSPCYRPSRLLANFTLDN